MQVNSPRRLASCHCCGLVQRLPAPVSGRRPICCRCSTTLAPRNPSRNCLSASLALSALMLYVPATTLPMLRIEQFGHRQEDSLLSGVATLFAQDYWLVGTVVLLFSVILPPLKLTALLVLASAPAVSADRVRALLFRAVESLGRWGMLDVMLVAILVAYVKLGGLISIKAGPGLVAFTLLVLLSLLASVSFNPHMLWKESAR